LVLDSQLRQLVAIEQEVKMLDQHLANIAQHEPKVQLLMTMPGVNYVVALGLLAALGDITRFRDGDHAAAYVGLVPSTRQSGDHCYHGHITKRGRSQTRGLLTQSAQHAARHPGPIGAFFRRLAKRKNRSVAITAVARKLVTIAFLMLKNNEPYRYARPELMRKKFVALEILPKGRKANGSAPRAKPGLADVYRAAKLPRVTIPDQLPKGEQKMLANRKLRQFVQELYLPPTAGGKDSRSSQKSATVKLGRPLGRPK
jgi:hypothetical protein